MIFFEILGTPIPKARARTYSIRADGKVANEGDVVWRKRSHTPPKVVLYERKVKEYAFVARQNANIRRWDKELVEAYLSFRLIRPGGYPDLDNLVKCVLDGCKGIIFRDDRQVISLRARKCYPVKGEPESVFACFRTIELGGPITKEGSRDSDPFGSEGMGNSEPVSPRPGPGGQGDEPGASTSRQPQSGSPVHTPSA